MLSIRCSDLDEWVRYIEPERDEFEVSTEDFIARLLRRVPPSEDMECGTAFHALLERAELGDLIGGVDEHGEPAPAESKGFRFIFAGDFPLTIPAQRERFVEKVYRTPVGPVLLRGKVDAIEADGTVTDYKLTSSTFDAERYAESLQWRAYLDILGARRFSYLVFQAKRSDRNVTVNDLHPLVFWSYPAMHSDVAVRVGELAGFIMKHVPELARKAVA